ncbi:hypothetical protein B0J12DRAFT_751170 [Macrophomina phaseolina]|uniref:Uncharacterized protein n=1 Tax=Macrophomina phaseolina TaxID=35725 RepID=A0ABQ8GHV4_9PEZI|nr:hypothetical protein B0J12DRAFT_751170 [Macrophomina phaseolina]
MASSAASPATNDSPNINVSDAPSVIAWQRAPPHQELVFFPAPDCKTLVLCSIRFTAASGLAFFMLRFPVELSVPPRTKRAGARAPLRPHRPLFSAEEACRSRGPEGTSGPQEQHIQADIRDGGVARPDNALHGVLGYVIVQSLVQALCDRVCNGSLRLSGRDASLKSLYGGKGGVAIEGPDFKLSMADNEPSPSPTDSPPSYDELAPSPPPVASKKRRIDNTVAPSAIKDERSREMEKLLQELSKRVMREVSERLEEMETRLADRIDQRLEQQFNERLKQQLDGPLAQLKQEQEEHTQERLDETTEDIMADTSELIDIRIDDQIQGVKEELHDYVKEELKDVEDRIKEDIVSLNISLSFD